jgi:ABC-2 type transport system ATP-binding protein
MTVFLNSHLLSEVEMVCDRVAIVDRGRVVRSGQLGELLGGTPELRVTVDRIDAPLLDLMTHHGRLLDVKDTTLTIGVDSTEIAARLSEALIRGGYCLYAMVPSHQSLEDLFVSLVEPTSDRS